MKPNRQPGRLAENHARGHAGRHSLSQPDSQAFRQAKGLTSKDQVRQAVAIHKGSEKPGRQPGSHSEKQGGKQTARRAGRQEARKAVRR